MKEQDKTAHSAENLTKSYLSRVNRALAGRSIEQTLKDTRAIIGAANMPPTELGKLAEKAVEALQNMMVPSAIELSALETIIRLMRPVPLSVGGELEEIDEAILPRFEHWKSFKKNIKPYLYSIGRITLPPNEGIGTGFLISKNLLVTNRHVLDQISHGTMILEKGQATIKFGYERGVAETERLSAQILSVKAVHPTFDIALFEIESQVFDARRQPLDISSDEPPEKGMQVAAIGYPFKDSRNPLFIDGLFGGIFGVKRAAIGEVLETTPNSVFHDCSTLGGNSGSPIFSMKNAKVIGLHRDGYFLYRNEAVNVADLNVFVQENI